MKRGRQSWKAITLDIDKLAQGQTALYELTAEQANALLAMCEYFGWSTRWTNAPISPEKFRADARQALMSPIDFCSLMVDCIETNPDVFDAIAEKISERGLPPPSSESSPADGASGSVLVTGCDLDSIYGQCVALEDYIAQVSEDFIEVVSNAPGTVAAIARAIDTIPVLGDLPVLDDLNDIVTWLQVQGVSTFTAGYTTTVRQNNICAMWERACDDCELSMTDILDVYVGGGSISYAFNDPLRLLIQAVVGNVAPTLFAYGVMAFVTGALATGGEVFGLLGLSGLQTIAASGDPDGDHAIFCNPCPQVWQKDFDFTAQDFAQYVTPTNATYTPVWTVGTGYEGGRDALGCRDGLWFTFPVGASVTRIRAEFNASITASNNRTNGYFVQNTSNSNVYFDTFFQQSSGSFIADNSGLGLANVGRINVQLGSRNGAASYCRLTRLYIEGTGTNPFP